MNQELKEKWDEAEKTGKSVSLGVLVICDVCGEDFTNSLESGGFIFGSYAYCPDCAGKSISLIRRHKEGIHIKAICPQNKSFADFVREYRGNNNFIQVKKEDR